MMENLWYIVTFGFFAGLLPGIPVFILCLAVSLAELLWGRFELVEGRLESWSAWKNPYLYEKDVVRASGGLTMPELIAHVLLKSPFLAGRTSRGASGKMAEPLGGSRFYELFYEEGGQKCSRRVLIPKSLLNDLQIESGEVSRAGTFYIYGRYLAAGKLEKRFVFHWPDILKVLVFFNSFLILPLAVMGMAAMLVLLSVSYGPRDMSEDLPFVIWGVILPVCLGFWLSSGRLRAELFLRRFKTLGNEELHCAGGLLTAAGSAAWAYVFLPLCAVFLVLILYSTMF